MLAYAQAYKAERLVLLTRGWTAWRRGRIDTDTWPAPNGAWTSPRLMSANHQALAARCEGSLAWADEDMYATLGARRALFRRREILLR